MKKALVLIAVLSIAACAVMEPPSGGPKDEDPPVIMDISPVPGTSGVSRDSDIRITFSEKIDGDSFKKLVRVYPDLEFGKIGSDGDILKIEFARELPETTICVMIGKGYTDLHKVKGKRRIQFCFSTADSLDSGSISGRVLFKMSPDSTGLAKLVALSAIDSTGDVMRAKESRMAFCGSDGSFKFQALPADGKSFRLWAFTDKNGDTRFSSGDEFATVLEDTFTLDRGMTSIQGIEINIIDPDEPGRIEGKMIDLTGLGIYPTARFDPLYDGGKTVMAYADSTGSFTVMSIAPGGYLMTAFIDAVPDSVPGSRPDPSDSTRTLSEPFSVYPDTISVPPGGTVTLEPIYISDEKNKDE